MISTIGPQPYFFTVRDGNVLRAAILIYSNSRSEHQSRRRHMLLIGDGLVRQE